MFFLTTPLFADSRMLGPPRRGPGISWSYNVVTFKCQMYETHIKKVPKNNHMFWLVVGPPLWKMMEFVNWDDEIPNIWERMATKPPTSVFYMSTKQSNQFFFVEKWAKVSVHLCDTCGCLVYFKCGYLQYVQHKSFLPKYTENLGGLKVQKSTPKHSKFHLHSPRIGLV